MAINVNIPGIGTVSVDGAASEETIKQVLSAMRAMNQNMVRQQQNQKKSTTQPTSTSEDPIAGLISSTKEQMKQQTLLSRAYGGLMDRFKIFGGGMTSIMKDIAKTGLSVATAWMTSADAMADDPIRAGAQMINTGIDLMAKAVTTATDAISKIAGGIPLVGGVIKGAGEAFKAAVELASTVFKIANEFMAAEFQKTVESFGKLNRIGATFGGGMDELNEVVTASGIPMSKFTEAVVNSRENITAMGLNVASAAKLVSSGLSRLSTTTGVSGKALREELLLLGFNYQEQGELVAEYTANMIAAGRSRSDIDRDVAQGTAKYAKDLKILSDITGEDARKRMAEARRESMRASLMNKLNSDQREAFAKAYASLAQAGPEAQEALIQKLSIGEVINPAIAMNETLMGLINNVSSRVEAGSTDIIVETTTALANAAADLRSREKDLGTALDIAKLAGGTGVVGTAADIFNRIAAIQMTPEQIAESSRNVDTNIQNSGKTGQAFADATRATNDFAVAMGDIARRNMPEYAGLISRATTETTAALNSALAEANKIGRSGIKAYAEEKAEEIKNQLGSAFNDFKKYLSDDFLPKLALSIKEALPWWLGGGKADTRTQAQRDADNAPSAALADAATVAAAGMPAISGDTPTGSDRPPREGVFPWLSRMFGGRGMATGGVVSGPNTGYPVLLHGAEAVVPLPDGRSIPVEMSQRIDASGAADLSKLEELISKQADQMQTLSEIMREMVSVAQDHRDISRDIYDASA